MMERQLASFKLPSSPEKSLTRAISFSELPTSRRVVIQHAESSGGSVKQYCEEVYDKISNTRQVNVLTTITSPLSPKDNVWSPAKYSTLSGDNSTGWHRRIHSFTTPADLDNKSTSALSLSGLRISDISPPKKLQSPLKLQNMSKSEEIIPSEAFNPQEITSPPESPANLTDRQDTTNLKKKTIRPLAQPIISRSPETRNSLSKLSFMVLVSIAIVIISMMLMDFNEKPNNFTNTTLELTEKMFGQSEAIEKLISRLQNNPDNLTAILLVGGTGVGKTYTANIMKKHFPYKYHIFEVFPPIEAQISIVYDALSRHHCNLLIVDNLRTKNTKDFINLMKYLQGQEKNPCVILLGILNPQIVDENMDKTVNLERTVEYLEHLFDREEVMCTVIAFKPLDSETIERCIMREAQESGIELSDKEYQEVKAQLTASNSGCKGAHPKVNLFQKKKQSH